MASFGYLDFLFMTIVIFVSVMGFFKGFAKELCGFFGIILGMFFASRFAYDGGEWFRNNVVNIENKTFDTILGFLIIYLMIWILSIIIGKLLDKLFESMLPKYLNRLLGMLFGAIKSFLAIAIVLHLAFRLEILQSLKAHCSYNSTFYSTMDKIASAIISSKLITTAPKNAQEVKQEIQNLKDDAIQKLQEGSQKLVDKAKQTIEEVDKDPAQPKSQEGQ
ncbi:CvpA family protein [uncultured Helicobacter sp.]|uniref:CvpA family protein n=1 Tax=uncultured Helicobacter sp. TaxID=175537 RepID=UPI001F85B354|nr:CvpA family protein [uncultured Helicobacter sp.]HIY43730.1 CvpA family protein [Candidatus Helicobacter avistercoris]